METKKCISIEKSALYMLVRWHNIEEYDYKGVVQNLYKNHKLIPSKLATTDLGKAPLMRDPWTRAVIRDKKGDRYFDNLNGVIELYKSVVGGDIELDVVPSVLQGVIYDANNMADTTRHVAELALAFIREYGTVLRVNEEDYDEFFETRRKLAKQYIDAGILNDKQYVQACALAESAMFGLNYVVKKDNIYIHDNYIVGDRIKMKKIAAINRDAGMIAEDKNSNSFIVPQVWTPTYVLIKDRANEKGVLPYDIWISARSIEDDTYVPKSKR